LNESVLVTGANGVIGPFLTAALARNDYHVMALTRTDRHGSSEIQGDLEQPESYSLPGEVRAVVHAAPIWLLEANLAQWHAAGLARLIVFSSSSSATKTHSPSGRERGLAEKLLASERHCRTFCDRHDIACTIFSPTLIYGYGRDRNISRIAGWIRKYGFFPIAGKGRGKRQPVHTDDLVAACLAVMHAKSTHGKSYFLSGGETLSYREMVERIFVGLGVRPHIIRVPVAMYRIVLQFANRLQLSREVDPAMADRMEQDLCFDHSNASTDFGYTPSRFLIDPVRDLPGAG
jgi:nucleoside-diphosphate-sugar epimerase